MTANEKVNKFLELQNKGVSIEDIAKDLEMEVKALQRFMNRNGYKSNKGIYTKKEEKDVKQLELTIPSSSKSKSESKNKKVANTKSKVKTSAKVNISAEDIDKLCEVYDWYLSIKDLKTLQPKKKKNSQDINIDKIDMSKLKSTSIKVEKSTWDEFERLCSNSEYTKQEIITQAIKNFLKEYQHLL